ncbi:hypothetical protein LOZ80_10880 [Paenibacillus sp. HWE-109]|uniref:hypothetical protein n=1 Tax=Paenibacillus sp. HWE-109 TaxID=1306526 RepID=UPI001EDF9EB9|nr:hypothetical protein [Paenibacillus sp. HWE-109]UKS29399.1 hypothetical protein LOZ80_10880 [Paenibacillus sp. HWE-109]
MKAKRSTPLLFLPNLKLKAKPSIPRNVKVQVFNVQGNTGAIPIEDVIVFARILRANRLFQEYCNISFSIGETQTININCDTVRPGSLCCVKTSKGCVQRALTTDLMTAYINNTPRLQQFASLNPKTIIIINTGLSFADPTTLASTVRIQQGKKTRAFVWISPNAVAAANAYTIAHEFGHVLLSSCPNFQRIADPLSMAPKDPKSPNYQHEDPLKHPENLMRATSPNNANFVPQINDQQIKLFYDSPYVSICKS